MEHEKLPGDPEGKYLKIHWWEITLEIFMIASGIVLGNIILLGVGLYLLFSSVVLKGAFKDEE